MVGIPELFSFNDHSLHWRVPTVRSRRTSSGSSLLAEILDIVMTETGPPIATPKPFRYRPVPLYPEDWESVCSAQDINGGSAKKVSQFWSFQPLMSPDVSASLSTASPIDTNPQKTYHQSAHVSWLESGLWNAGSTMWTKHLPFFGIHPSNVSSISANATLLAALPSCNDALPWRLDDHLVQPAGFLCNNGHVLVDGLHGFQTRQGPLCDKANADGMGKVRDDTHVAHMTGFSPQYALMPTMTQTESNEAGVIVQCEARTEVPTINPSIALRNNRFGTNGSESMATPWSVDSDTSLFGVADTVATSPESCLLLPRASSYEFTVDIPAAVLNAVDESKISGNLSISRAIPPANVSGVSSNKTVGLKRKRNDSISSASVCESDAASQLLAKHGVSDSCEGMPSLEKALVVPSKRKPGRPLSTSSTARSIVRHVAALHVHRNESQARPGSDFLDDDLQAHLPPFPRVSAYIGEQELSSDSYKVAAKKHRELIKERTKNLEDVNVYLGQALIEYERCHSKLVNTIARLRKENEALLLHRSVP